MSQDVPSHEHDWVRCAPGTVGAGAASYCACGLYAVDPMRAEGEPDYYVHSADRARTIRLLTQQGYVSAAPASVQPEVSA